MIGLRNPYMDASMWRWLERTAARHAWRVAGHDEGDLLQEGLICWVRCQRRYVGHARLTERGRAKYLPHVNPNNSQRRHFMSLVKTAFLNRITTLAKVHSIEEQCLTDLCDRAVDDAWEIVRPDISEGETASVMSALASMPIEIKQVLDLLIEDGLRLTGHRRFGTRRETTNAKLSRELGLAKTAPLREMVEEHFVG